MEKPTNQQNNFREKYIKLQKEIDVLLLFIQYHIDPEIGLPIPATIDLVEKLKRLHSK